MRSVTRIIGVAALALLAMSCTKQQRAKKFGGEAEINLPTGARLVNATWKDSDLWVLTKYDPLTKPQAYAFTESSSFGILEGKIVLVEH